MKILYIINNLGSGGAEKLIEESLPIFKNIEGVDVDLLLLSDKNNVFGAELIKNGIKIDVVPIKNPKNILNIFYIKKHIEKGDYDIIHAHLFPTLYWVSIASKLMFTSKPKFVYTEHSTYNRRRNKKTLKYLEKFIYSSFDKIVSISDAAQKNLINWLKPKQKNIQRFTIINNGINIKKFKEAKPYDKCIISEKLTNNTKLLCMVGRFSEAKDQTTIIKMLGNISKNIHLLLLGEGPLKELNKKLAEDIGVSNRVHFLGYRDDIERILKISDIIIQSSNWEGFGLAAIEGMAAGKPVIVSDVEGLRNVVGNAGVLFEKGNEEELSHVVDVILRDKRKYEDLVERSLNKANSYNINAMVKEILKLYGKL